MDTTDGDIKLISDVINTITGVEMSVLMGANIAMDVAKGDFCESTIGCRSEEQGRVLKTIFNTETFRINVVKDVAAVELCGALKVGVVGVVCSALKYMCCNRSLTHSQWVCCHGNMDGFIPLSGDFYNIVWEEGLGGGFVSLNKLGFFCKNDDKMKF